MNKREELFNAINILQEAAKEDPKFVLNHLFGLNKSQCLELSELISELRTAHENKNTTLKGRKLEETFKFIFKNCRNYEVISNLRDSSNEIDLLLKLNDLGRVCNGIEEASIIPKFIKDNENIICECKNYNKTIGVTWVGKFFSLLQQRGIKLGVIVSYHGVAGQGEWDSSKGLIKKFFLKHNIAILDINLDDLEEISKGISVLDKLEQKYYDLVFQTNLEKHISTHPAQ